MKIIALHGPADCGKTQTLNVVYQLLLNKGYTQVIGHFSDFADYNFIGQRVHGAQDFSDILILGGKSIGVMTGYEANLPVFFKEAEKAGCEVVICAYSDAAESLGVVKAYSENVIIEKTPESEISLKRINDNDFAKKIIALI